MAKPNARIKSAVLPVRIPQSHAQTADWIREIGERQREIARIEADMNDALAACKAEFEALAQPHREAITALNTGAQMWCEANRDALTQQGKTKTALFPTGEVQWRLRPPSVVLRGTEAVLDHLRRLNLRRFIRTKDEVNKEAILLEPKAVACVPGISISQGEDFLILPFEAELNPVA